MARSTLPPSDAPLHLADGTVVAPTTATTFSRTQVPNNQQAARLVSNTKRKLAELPGMPKQLNTISAILMYTLSGLADGEIAVALGFTIDQVARIRDLPAYSQFEQYIVDAVKQQSADAVKDILADGEVAAARKIVKLVETDDTKVALAASKDILDRGGHGAKQVVDIRANMMNTFRIEVVDKRNEVPVIEHEDIE